MMLDRIDRHILDLLQDDNQIANVALAEHVGLSPPACSRRLARLRHAGVISKDVSIVDPSKVGKTLTAIVAIVLKETRKECLEAFGRRMQALDAVQQCYVVAGAVTFVLVAVLDDMPAYSAFAAEALAEEQNIKSYETWFVLSQVKNEPRIKLRT